MKGRTLPNVRLVRCPKCRKVLPEPVDVPFYKCGGCSTILQAKHYKKANERRNLVSEASGSGHNDAEDRARGGEAISSNPPLIPDPNEGINRINAESGNSEQPAVSEYSTEASLLSQPKQQLSCSRDQHLLEPNEESELNLEVTNTLSKHSSLNELSSPSHEVPSNLGPEKGELEGDRRSAEKCGDSIASSSNESVEQLAQKVLETGKVRQNEIAIEERLEDADSRSEAASSEPSTAKTAGEADEMNQDVGINCRLEQPGVIKFPSEAILSDEPSLQETNKSLEVDAEEEQAEGSCTKDKPELSNFSSESILSNEVIVGGDELPSQLGSPNQEAMTKEQQFVADGYSDTLTSSTKSTVHENKELSQIVTENQEIVEGRIQHEIGTTSNEDPVEIISPPEVNSKLPDEPETVLPESAKMPASIISLSSEVLTAPDGNRELQYLGEDDVTADENKSVCALPTLRPTAEGELLGLEDRSQKSMEINRRDKIKEEKATETTEVVDTSCRDVFKSPTRSSFAYDASVSSYDGNDDQIMHQFPPEIMQSIKKSGIPAAENRKQYPSGRSTTSIGSAYQPRMDNIQAEEESIPVLLNEIKMPEVLTEVPYRRWNRTRPRTQEFLPRVPLHTRSGEMQYESSDHKELYEHPPRYYPYGYRDVESRVTTREHLHSSDMDGRMISESVWVGEEFHTYPCRESSTEIYPYPRHHMNDPYRDRRRRQTEYQPPLVYNMGRVAYSGDQVRSGYRVVDSYSQPYPVRSDIMRWSGGSYGRAWYAPSDSYTATPTYSTDSDYYSRSRDTSISEDQRHTNQRMRRKAERVQHFQPIGGAAPFIICHYCSELLQLPSDFLVFKGIKVHRVKCSACSTILKFTLQKGCHLVPYVPKSPMAPSPLTEKVLAKSASSSQPNHDCEAMHTRSSSARDSQSFERPKSKQFQDKGKSVMVEMHNNNAVNAQGSSSPDITPRNAKVTWKLPNRTSSPLHRLMGYSSPSAVLNGYDTDGFEAQSQSRRGTDSGRKL